MQQTTQDKLIDGTLTVEHGDAMTLVFGKEKGGYAKGVGSGVTYNKYFDVPRSTQSADARVALLERQLEMERLEREKERRECEDKEPRETAAKDQKISDLSQEVAQTKGMVSQLLSQLSAKGITFPENEVEPIVSIKTFLLLTFTYFCLS
jgi:hypothetical protein